MPVLKICKDKDIRRNQIEHSVMYGLNLFAKTSMLLLLLLLLISPTGIHQEQEPEQSFLNI